ncbi:hypothetical protein FZEAL_5224 [Fusarium zealandicum]|uniref:Uncharacterized protein n=1 Tax=Fusarium zealandicum TaxID=1053134 RepID=A0A8H4XKT7_9HYPO|nr:hypothetical protein FZEAL_5224 [Fusarium zealandicum]
MSAIASRAARSAIALQPLPALQRGLRTSSLVRQAKSEPFQAKPPKSNQNQNKYLALGAVAVGAGFYIFYQGGRPANVVDAPGEAAGMPSARK